MSEFETVDYSQLSTLSLALSNYFAHSLPNGDLYKNDIGSLATFIAPYVTSVGASGFIEVSSTALPTPIITNGYSIVGAGTYTKSGQSNVVATGDLNIIGWNGTVWSLIKAITLNLTDYAKKTDVPDLVIEQSQVSGTNYINLFDESSLSVGFVDGTGGLNQVDTDWRKMRSKPLAGISKITLSSQAGAYNPSNNKNVVFYTSSDSFISRLFFNSDPITLDVPPTAAYAWINVGYTGDGDNVSNILAYKLMMNIGTVEQPYVDSSVQQGTITNILGYRIPTGDSSPIDYTTLKSLVTSSGLIAGNKYKVTSAPGGLTAIVTASSANTVNESIEVVEQNYDFFKIDLVNNKIYAFDNISGIARNSGGWYFINDTDHKPKGMASISALTPDIMQIVYSKTYSKICSLVYSPDETYALSGIGMGASVGNNVSNFNFSCNGLFGSITSVGSTLTIDTSKGYRSPLKGVTFDSTTGVITVTTSECKDSSAIISSKNASQRAVLISTSDTSIQFKMVDNSGTTILTSTSMSFDIVRNGVRKLSNADVELAGSNVWIQGLMMNEFQ